MLDELLALDPPDTADDAEWDIAKDRDGYWLSSRFALTFAIPQEHEDIGSALSRFRIGLQADDGSVRGEVWFGALSTEALLDAMSRLLLVEHLCLGANKAVAKTLRRFWGRAKTELAQWDERSLAERFVSGGKRRRPL